jgi:tetratricopeptide (TPR) repeat protein
MGARGWRGRARRALARANSLGRPARRGAGARAPVGTPAAPDAAAPDAAAPDAAAPDAAASVPASPSDEARARYAIGNERRSADDLRGAAAAYEEAIALDDRPARYHYRLAVCLAKVGDWEPAARAYAEATARDDRQPRWFFRLGTARRQCGDWPGALEAYEAAVERAPEDAKYHYWLGHARRQLDDLAGAAEAYRAALANGYPEEVQTWYWLGFTRARLGDVVGAREAIGEAFAALGRAELGPPHARWFHKLGELQEQTDDLDGARGSYEQAIELDGDDAAHRRALAGLHRRRGDLTASLSVLEAAVGRGVADADLWFHLGVLLEKEPLQQGVRALADVGLLAGPRGDWERAQEAYLAAIALDPTVAEYHYRLGRVRYKARDPEGAVSALTHAVGLDPSRAEWFYRLGRATAALGHRRGAYTPEELEGSNRAYERALELRPDHAAAREQLTRNRIRAAQWRAASHAAWPPSPTPASPTPASPTPTSPTPTSPTPTSPTPTSPTPASPTRPGTTSSDTGLDAAAHGTLRGFLEDEQEDPDPEPIAELLARPASELAGVPREWWFPLHWRLLSLKRFTLAYRAKEILAERTVAEGTDSPGLSRGLEVVRALTYLERQEEALDRLGALGRATATELDALTVRKYTADVRVSMGEVDDHVAMLELYARSNPPAGEDRFRSLVEGASVALVAPAHPELEQGEEIDGFDVVIRTKYVPSDAGIEARRTGARTDISYYAVGSSPFVTDDIAAALRDGQLRMVVFRTTRYPWQAHHIVGPGDLRFVPSEYRASFRASQFAVQRIVYDVIRYRPRVIKVFNSNFFASPREYRRGYGLDPRDNHAARGLVRPLSAFAHDYRSDFVFTRRIARAGLIEVDATAARLLELTPAEYLAVMDRKRTAAGTDVAGG